MEDDRELSNLGAEGPADVQSETGVTTANRVPKRRFIGRRAAAERAAVSGAANASQNGNSIEDSGGAVQGATRLQPVNYCDSGLTVGV